MPVVRISDELFKRLQAHAAPLVDSVSDVLARMVDAYEGISTTKGAQAKPVESLSALNTHDGRTTVWRLVSDHHDDPDYA